MASLIQAIQQAATALSHATWQRDTALAQSQAAAAAQQPQPLQTPSDLPLTVGSASLAVRVLTITFESLMCVWLCHCVADPSLRVADESQVRAFAALPAVAAAIAASDVAPRVLQQIIELSRV